MDWTARTTEKRSQELLEFMQLADREKTMIADYSHGMQKKLALAASVIHGPRILFLDEPFEGVDALAAGALKALLGRMTERGVTIFLTSHVLEIVGTVVQPCGDHPQRQAGRPGLDGRITRGHTRRSGRKENAGADFPVDCGTKRCGASAAGGIDVADVTRLPGVFEQVRLVAGLRWRS